MKSNDKVFIAIKYINKDITRNVYGDDKIRIEDLFLWLMGFGIHVLCC